MRVRTKTPLSTSTTDHAIQRLERNNQQLEAYHDTLRSYVCEPKTYNLFERLQQLKRRMDHTRKSNQEFITLLREQRVFMDGQIDRLKKKFQEFQELEHMVLEYIGMARMHC